MLVSTTQVNWNIHRVSVSLQSDWNYSPAKYPSWGIWSKQHHACVGILLWFTLHFWSNVNMVISWFHSVLLFNKQQYMAAKPWFWLVCCCDFIECSVISLEIWNSQIIFHLRGKVFNPLQWKKRGRWGRNNLLYKKRNLCGLETVESWCERWGRRFLPAARLFSISAHCGCSPRRWAHPWQAVISGRYSPRMLVLI